MLEVELQFPNQAGAPLALLNLAIGLKLRRVADPADPADSSTTISSP
jgi:hypothetical protein